VQSRTTVVETHMTKIPSSADKDWVRVTMTYGNMISATHYEGGPGPGLASVLPSR
jgi:hypothetical protein